jgi:hypothetical protein
MMQAGTIEACRASILKKAGQDVGSVLR